MPAVAVSEAPGRLEVLDRMRLTIISTAIALVVFVQSSGTVAADTKLDLIVDPARFLQRALSIWDPNGSSGQLQDQAYGYLFPMGPFFLVGKWLALPPWVIQRSWESAILIVAFLGMRRLARLLGVQGFWPCVTAGLGYALAPRMLTELFSISSELLPIAVLPWLLIPLVLGSTGVIGSPRRAAMLSGLALLGAGGINASATLAVLPVPALWLLTRSRGPRRAALIRWWLLAVVLASLWWAIPLVVLGKYSPPFLNWIESAAVTTSQNSLIAIARGADHWQAYLGPNVWPAGWIYAVAPAAIFATAAIAALGLAGLAGYRVPHRSFLVSTALLGFAMLAFGHSAPLGSPVAGSGRQLLDTTLVAFRNLHKFDALVRLPVAVGLGHLVAAAREPVRDLARRVPASQREFAPLVTVLALVGLGAVAAAPALTNHLVQQPRVTTMPGYWPQAAQWLDSHASSGRALVIPGAGRPDMIWGSTIDEPIQAVAGSPWATREAVPLGQPGYIRLLDTVEQLIATGTPQPELAPLLRRSGIGYLVIRADLKPTADATDLGLVLSTVQQSPGLSPAASFGPKIRDTGAANRLIDEGAGNGVPTIQILAVAGGSSRVSLLDASAAVAANGSADELPNLIDAGLSENAPVLFGDDAAAQGPSSRQVLDDGLRKREIPFGHPGTVAATMTSAQPYQTSRVVHDYLPTSAGALTTMQYGGIADVRASSSGSDTAAFVNRGVDRAPWFAIDGDAKTSWLSGSADGAVGQWLELDFLSALDTPTVTVQFAPQLTDYPSALTIRTDAGTVTTAVTPDGQPQQLRLPKGATQRLRLTVAAMISGTRGVATGFAEVAVGGVLPARTLQIPTASDPDVIDFRAAAGQRSGCLAVSSASSCRAALARTGEESAGISRSFQTTTAGNYRTIAKVVVKPGPVLDDALDRGAQITVSASSTANDDPRQRPGAVVDGLPGTTWSAATSDSRPTLTLTWPQRSTVRSLTLQTSEDAPVSRPTSVEVRAAGQSWTLAVDDAGTVDLPQPIVTNTLSVRIVESAIRVSTDSASGNQVILPAGVSELQVDGVSGPPLDRPVTINCASGPVLSVDGQLRRFSVSASRQALLAGAEVNARPCGAQLVSLAAGDHRLELPSTELVQAAGITLSRGAGLATAAASQQPRIQRWSSTFRSVAVSTAQPGLLVVHENFNKGWRASLHGHRLTPVQVDAWQQAFLLPAASVGTVELSFGPARVFTVGLGEGLAAVLLLCLLAFVRTGREPSPSSLTDGEASFWLSAAVLGVLLVATAGLAGFVASVLAACAARGLARAPGVRWRRYLPWCAGFAVGLAGLLNAIGPSVSGHPLTDSRLTQALVLGALGVLAVSAMSSGRGPAPEPQPE